MKSKVRIKKQALKAIKRIEKIAKNLKGPSKVKVGLPKGSNAYPDGTSVIMVGAVHEFGSPARNIPQRSFLRSTVNNNRQEYRRINKKLASKIISGDLDSKQALGLLGLKVEGDVKQRITDIKIPPLKSPSKKRGGSPNPLVDTGHLRRVITHVVE